MLLVMAPCWRCIPSLRPSSALLRSLISRQHTTRLLAAASRRSLCQVTEVPGASDTAFEGRTSRFHDLVEKGDLAEVQQFLAAGHHPDERDAGRGGTTALLLACRRGHIEIAQLLIQKGASLESSGAWGYTPLMYASVFGHLEVVALLLSHGADVAPTDQRGKTALDHAVSEGQIEIAQALRNAMQAKGLTVPVGDPHADTEPTSTQRGKGTAQGGRSTSYSGFDITPMTNQQVAAAASKLSELQRQVALDGATERAFTGVMGDGSLYVHEGGGLYCGILSGLPLFASGAKFDSGTGWPSFTQPFDAAHVDYIKEAGGRIEVVDAKSQAHLGHVFKDGPPPLNLRFCINAAALHFVSDQDFPRTLKLSTWPP